MRCCYRPCHSCCFCRCMFLRMVVWQPFSSCWRYIIARVSEMHVAYQIIFISCGLPLHRNEQKQTVTKTKSRQPTPLHLTCIIVGGGEKQGNARVRFLVVFREFVPILFLRICVVYCYCSSVWSFGSHFTLAGV
jgi:hypothetical protein